MKEKHLDKISKLLAMAESAKAIGNTDEAGAFATKAQKMLLQHDLSMDDVELFAAKNEPISLVAISGDLPFPLWQQMLLKTIAQVNGCFQAERADDGRPCIAGRKRDREITLNFFQYFVDAAAKLEAGLRTAYLESVEYFTSGEPIDENNVEAYLWGYAGSVCQRLDDVYGDRNREAEDVNPQALVFLEGRESQARKWLETKGAVIEEAVPLPEEEKQRYDRDYVMAGAVDGDQVALTDKILGEV